jgi:hypothetical protein
LLSQLSFPENAYSKTSFLRSLNQYRACSTVPAGPVVPNRVKSVLGAQRACSQPECGELEKQARSNQHRIGLT